MFTSRQAVLRFGAAALALTAFTFASNQAQAFSPFTGCIGQPIPIPGGGGGGGGGGGQQQPMGIQRATGILSNPVNFKQYAQITGVGPIVGTVRIYNQFGVLAMQNSQGGGGFGGGLQGGGFGGFGGGGFGGGGGGGGNQLPGMGVTGQGDDPPQGVLLHVNYANMFLPNQQQINGGGGQGFGGGGGGFGLGGLGLGGIGGIGGKGLGVGGFGNGGHGL